MVGEEGVWVCEVEVEFVVWVERVDEEEREFLVEVNFIVLVQQRQFWWWWCSSSLSSSALALGQRSHQQT